MSSLRYRNKQPPEVEAMQFTGGTESFEEIREWMRRTPIFWVLEQRLRFESPIVLLGTPEGTHSVEPGDYIVHLYGDEFYPLKPIIFEAIYEPQ